MLPNSNSVEVEARPTWEIILSENMFTVAVRRYESSDWLSESWRPSELIQQLADTLTTVLSNEDSAPFPGGWKVELTIETKGLNFNRL